QAAVEAPRRPRADLRPRLAIERSVPFHEAGAEATHDHLRGLVESLSRFVHGAPEGLELAPGEAATDTEAEAAAAQVGEDGDLLSDAQGIVPGQDHRGGTEPDVGTFRGEVGHELEVVRAERVVVEVMLHGPEDIEAEVGGETREPELLVPDVVVRHV